MGNVTRETTPETLGPNPQLGKRRQRLWEQIRDPGNDAGGSGSKSAIRETMPEALGANPRSGNRCQRRWEQIRDPGIDARDAGSKSAIRETMQNIFRMCRQADFRHFRLITILSNNLKK